MSILNSQLQILNSQLQIVNSQLLILNCQLSNTPALRIDAIATVGIVLSPQHRGEWAFTTITRKFSGLMIPW
ncbi:MAG: hypothetical protein GDA48_15390 [Hormoscilla sp. GM102CHS1]|nr:hypothetical protein [Hormoscilla sp. GM102CHS1]